jgi:rod shape-determining protein MreB
MKDGVIADFELTEIMLNEFIKKAKARRSIVRPRILICCPTNITPVEKNAIKEAAERTGARKVYIEEEPKVAAIGAGMDISKPAANMVLDIGGGTTDIAVLSMNGIVSSSSIKVAGNAMDQDIIKYIKEKYKLLIGEKTAENIKINFANVYNPKKSEKLEVKGRDLITGLPSSLEITQEETKEALEECISKIIKSCKNVLEQTPPELSSDIVEKGVILTGGGALLTGLVERLEEALTIPVLIAETPLTCVAEGCGILLNNLKMIEEDQ